MTTTAKFPAALLALADVGADTANIKTAVLSGAHNNSVTTITLTATVPSEWPTAGWVTIDGEIISYTAKVGATLTGATRGTQTAYGAGAAAAHNDASIVAPYLTAQQVNQMVAELIALETMEGQNADIASAGTTNLANATGRYINITGTTTITAFGTVVAGRGFILKFAGILTLTHNATTLIMRSGANATTAAGDVYAFVSEGSGNWREIWHLVGAAAPSATNITLGTKQATTSGTSITFTGIPSWAKRITVNLIGVSTNGTSTPTMRIGPSGGVETSGYSGAVSNQAGGSVGNLSSGFDMSVGTAASIVYHGTYTLTLEELSSNTWACTWILGRSDAAGVQFGAGSKALAGTLDRLSLTTAGGTDTFDAGAANITYE